MSKEQYLSLIKSALGGCAVGFGLSQGLSILIPLGVAVLWASRGSLAMASFWGFSAVLVSHSWLLALHPLTWIGVPQVLSLPITLLIWFLCGLYGAILVGFWTLADKIIFGKAGINASEQDQFFQALVMASVWGIAEVLLAQSPFFWIGLGQSFLPQDRIISGLARWVGSGGLAAINLLIGWWICHVFTSWKRGKSVKKTIIIGSFSLVIVHVIGWILLIPTPSNNNISIAFWQTAVPTREKFSGNYKNIPVLLDDNLKELEKDKASLLVAPEGTLQLGQELKSPASIPLLIGGFRWKGGEQRSSLLVFDEGEIAPSLSIDKYRLVPLGEWLPSIFGVRLPGLSAVGGVQPGNYSRLLEWNGPEVAVAICYELSDGTSLASAVRDGGQWIASISNLDPYPISLQRQFLSLAQLRSIETGRDLLSVANTGPTSLFFPSGKILPLLPSFTKGIGIAKVNLRDEVTIYNRVRETPLICALILGLLGRYFGNLKAKFGFH